MKQLGDNLIVVALILAGTLASPHRARAQVVRHATNVAQPGNADVTLHVPLQLQNMNPSATGAIVYCRVTKNGGGAPTATAQDTVPLTQGGYNGALDVKVSLQVAQPGEQWDYDCKLSFYSLALKTSVPPGGAPWAMPKAGTTPVGDATGTITTQ